MEYRCCYCISGLQNLGLLELEFEYNQEGGNSDNMVGGKVEDTEEGNDTSVESSEEDALFKKYDFTKNIKDGKTMWKKRYR